MHSHYQLSLVQTPGRNGVRLRELDGHAGIIAADGATPAVLEWLDLLLEEGPVRASELAISDRDRVLAEIYIREFGDRISSTIDCRRCGRPFDLTFSLRGLMRHLGEPVSQTDGLYRLEDGTRFRVPTGADELAIAALPEREREQRLLELCVVHDEAGPGAAAAGELESALASVAPLLSTELQAVCVECGEEQPLYFDIQTLLFLRLGKERRELVQDVHLLASAYKWSRAEILSLSREERRAYCAMISYERQ